MGDSKLQLTGLNACPYDSCPARKTMNKIAKIRRYAVNTFIACIIIVFTIDGLLALNTFHAVVQKQLDPLLKATGLWQGPWDLFAPTPDKENIRLSAEVLYPDGSVFRWQSEDWKEQARWYRFRRFRIQEYYDNARRDSNRAAWPGLARYVLQLAAEQPPSELSPIQVKLTRHWWTVPNPKMKFVRVANINEPMGSYQFYREVLSSPPGAR